MNRTSILTVLPAVFCFMTTGCKIGPDQGAPNVSALVGSDYRTTGTRKSAVNARRPWWHSYHDSGLDALERQVLTGNQELSQARARIIASRAAVRQNRAQEFPSAAIEMDLPGAASANLTKNGSTSRDLGAAVRSFPLLLDISYEVDLWGRVKRNQQAAAAHSEAVTLDADNARLFLTIEAARIYYQYRALEAEMAIADEASRLSARGLQLSKIRQAEGLVTGLEVTRREAVLAEAVAEQSDLQRDKDLTLHALAELSGQVPSQFHLLPAGRNFTSAVPEITAGLPAELLRRRADIAAAERELFARNAEIGEAMAASLPTLTLSAQGGGLGSGIAQLGNPASRFWMIGPALSSPLLDGGRNRENVKITQARYDEQIATYRQAVVTAVREVEDALVTVRACRTGTLNRTKSLKFAEHFLRQAQISHQSGVSGQEQLMEAQNALLLEKRAGIKSQHANYASSLQLIKALGGGWK